MAACGRHFRQQAGETLSQATSALLNGSTKRLYILGAVLCAWIALVALRLVQLQVLDYGDFTQRAQRQRQRTIDISPRRGVIYDRNGRELAMSVTVDSVFAVPSDIPDPQTAASLLAKILNLDAAELLAKFRSGHSFCWIARKLDSEVSQRIRALNLRGIYFMPESRRYYPKGELAAQVLGYVGVDDEGLSGIEHQFDDRLRGQPGTMLISMDARRRRFSRLEKQPQAGENLVLTIDQNIQYIAERELQRAMQETHAEAATIVIQNPHTGEILALANRPTFNPNNSRKLTLAQLKDRAVTDIYEPGSVFKIVTISAALEEKLTRPDEVVDCQMGAIMVNGLRIRDHERLGLLTVAQILSKSSDVGAIKLGLRLGDDRFYHYIRAFGFGEQTGIELPGETRGLARPVQRWSKVSIGALSMGQEIGVTPLQTVSMLSTIANGGVYVPARIVVGMASPAGPQQVAFHSPPGRRVISTLTAAQMRQMLEGVVLFGTGRKAILDGYSSAGKTGTAQKVDPATGAYSRSKYVASFAGFAPVKDPAISILVVIDSAQGLHQGGQIAAPVFQRVAQQVLAYLHVPHDVELKNNSVLRASVRDSELDESSPDRLGGDLMVDSENAQATAAPAASAAVGKRSLVTPAQSAKAKGVPANSATPPTPGTGTVVVEVEGGPTVPSFLGKSLRAAVEEAQAAGIELEAMGSGTAREQFPAAGSRLPASKRVAVRFAR